MDAGRDLPPPQEFNPEKLVLRRGKTFPPNPPRAFISRMPDTLASSAYMD
jgi:hypothetical protein